MSTRKKAEPDWRKLLSSVRTDRRRQIITDAYELGKLSPQEIGNLVGLTRQRVLGIVKEENDRRAAEQPATAE